MTEARTCEEEATSAPSNFEYWVDEWEKIFYEVRNFC